LIELELEESFGAFGVAFEQGVSVEGGGDLVEVDGADFEESDEEAAMNSSLRGSRLKWGCRACWMGLCCIWLPLLVGIR
jgi:hypothetical protein